MRAFLVFLPFLFASCTTLVSHNGIFEQARTEIARREPWADQATLLIRQQPDTLRLTWLVSAGAFDYSAGPGVHGLRIVPGTERELRFTRDGCLLGYHQPRNRCLSPQIPTGESESYAGDSGK